MKISTFVFFQKNLVERMSFAGKMTKSSDTVKLLGITLDRYINFK